MNLRTLPIAAAIFFAAVAACATTVRAQAAQSASAPPAQAATPAPASEQPAPQDASAPAATPQTSAKKVWSNEDMKNLDPHAGVSTVGKSDSKSTRPAARSATNGQARSADYYKQKIAKLQSQIPPLDTHIAELQAAIDGKPTGDAKESTRPAGVKFDTWANELAQFKKKRDDLVARIAALQDEARHNGVAPKDIP